MAQKTDPRLAAALKRLAAGEANREDLNLLVRMLWEKR